jgi:hypothetical protein
MIRACAHVRDLTPSYHGILGILMTEIVLDGRATSMDIDALSLAWFRAGRVHAGANMS